MSNVVIGGGIVGLLTAWHLSAAGRSVTVVDRGVSVGRESSWAGGGILSPIYPDRYPVLDPLVRESNEMYPGIVAEVHDLSGVDPELVRSGLLVLDEAQDQRAGQAIPDAALGRIEPALAHYGGAISFPVAQVRNPRLLTALYRALMAKGVRFEESCEVLGFEANRGLLTGVQTSKGIILATRCVVATGAWTEKLLAKVGLVIPVKPIRGQMIVFPASRGLISHIVVRDYRYLIPRADGRILVGSTVEDVGFDSGITQFARNELSKAAISLVPALAEVPIEHHWAGLRPGSPDDAPFIGEHPRIKGLFVCAGHHRNGFAIGPATARLVVDMVLGRRPCVDPSPFRLNRPCPEWPIPSAH